MKTPKIVPMIVVMAEKISLLKECKKTMCKVSRTVNAVKARKANDLRYWGFSHLVMTHYWNALNVGMK